MYMLNIYHNDLRTLNRSILNSLFPTICYKVTYKYFIDYYTYIHPYCIY